MRVGFLVIGILIMIISALIAYRGYTVVRELQTPLGQIGRAFSPELREKYEKAHLYVYGGIMGFIIGLGLTIYGAAAKRKTSI